MGATLESLALAVKSMQYRHHRTLDAKLMPRGITLVQWDALRAISRNPDASSHRLAQLTFQTDQSFGALAGRLLAHGWIERISGPGRAIRHRITPSGEAILHEGFGIYNEVIAQSFAPLSPAERNTLYDLLARLLEETGE
ncbi:MarR family transcriptional regulator [Dictyobacter sp. S3.2.2.5]|uniref:MarR family transcriptional regulator n=1 Tax=Dictyobacter halimunensis TaxID=3026934 RepID=A0ABQ6G3D5_9CHLR|nr:MarR family transcriptional regulator [Dictyobacter sp. S3.2.2.5]